MWLKREARASHMVKMECSQQEEHCWPQQEDASSLAVLSGPWGQGCRFVGGKLGEGDAESGKREKRWGSDRGWALPPGGTTRCSWVSRFLSPVPFPLR